MTWLLIGLLAAIALLLLLRVQQGYQKQGTNALLREAGTLRDEVDRLTERVEHLEMIATREDPPPDALDSGTPSGGGTSSDGPVASDDSSSVSLDRPRDRS